MNTKFQLQINIDNYEGGSHSVNTMITLKDLERFGSFIEMLKKNIKHTTWNWWTDLPDKWNGNQYVLDTWLLNKQFEENWGFSLDGVSGQGEYWDVNFFKEFFLRFTPNGGDSIEDISVYKLEKIL